MAISKNQQIKSDNKIAKLMYSIFSLDEIYVAAAQGMAEDSCCTSKTGIPRELTEEEFDRKFIGKPYVRPSKTQIEKFQRGIDDICQAYLKKHGSYYDKYRGLTETEHYAILYLSNIWYRDN